MSSVKHLTSAWDNAVLWWRNHRAERRARRAVADLPRRIRKDIGWPEESGEMPDRNIWTL